jgi:hypothetical protein
MPRDASSLGQARAGVIGQLWAIVLAGGEGIRLRPLTRHLHGENRPKQYATVLGERSLLRQTLDRIALLIPPERTVVVTMAGHLRWVGAELDVTARGPWVLAQPEDRGTAAGVLFPAHWIRARDDEAIVAVFPSDHLIRPEAAFMQHVEAAASFAEASDCLVLLGAPPTEPEDEYGWIETAEPFGSTARGVVYRVRRFVEKPSPASARALSAAGGLWNTFVFAARADTLIAGGHECVPSLDDPAAPRHGVRGDRARALGDTTGVRPGPLRELLTRGAGGLAVRSRRVQAGQCHVVRSWQRRARGADSSRPPPGASVGGGVGLDHGHHAQPHCRTVRSAMPAGGDAPRAAPACGEEGNEATVGARVVARRGSTGISERNPNMSVSVDELAMLMRPVSPPAVSIYLPTHRAVPETLQDPIRFKNLLHAADEQLLAAGARESEAKALLAPAVELLDDSHFWQHQRDGLAVFVALGIFRPYRVACRLNEMVVVSHRFHLKPLVPLVTGDSTFFLLALSQNQVRLFEGSRDTLGEIDLEGVPSNRAEALKYDDPQKQLQYRTSGPGRTATFHGHGTGIEEHKNNLLRFFRQVDAGVERLVRGQRAPLVLAGVEYFFPIYREASRYPDLVEDGIAGNPERLSDETLHQRAWSLLEPRFARAQEEAAARYRQLAGTGRTSTDVAGIVSAAHHGRVDVLFTVRNTQQWGSYDPVADRVQLLPEAAPGGQDLFDLALVQALSRKAAVHVLDPPRMPAPAPIAAIFRY